LKVREKILKILKNLADSSGTVELHSKYVERELIDTGRGSISVSRYLRMMRQEGLIDYEDPRRHNHYYIIKLKDVKVPDEKVELYYKEEKNHTMLYIDVRCKNCRKDISRILTRNDILWIVYEKVTCPFCHTREFEIRKHKEEQKNV